MRSLRLRFFLITWPLVIVSIAAVTFTVNRWTVVERERLIGGTVAGPAEELMAEVRDSVTAAWASLASPEGRVRAEGFARIVGPDAQLLVTDTAGVVVVSTDSTMEVVGRDGPATRLRRRERLDAPAGMRAVTDAEFALRGMPVRAPAGGVVGELFVLPVEAGPAPSGPEDAIAPWNRLRRTLWRTALAASLAAAAAALLLAGPLVRQVRRLSSTATAIRGGALSSRVGPSGSDELGELAQSFDAMAASLERADEHKRRLVSDVAHELRTPLTNIIGLIEAVQDGLRAPDAATLGALRAEAGLLARTVEELQELALAESGQLAFDYTEVDTVAAARAAVEALSASAGEVGLSGPTHDRPLLVRADATRLAQVLRNLLRNAITNTPAGGKVRIDVEARGEQVIIEVSDTGRGIPPEHLELIWERFHRVDPSRDRASGGMGLGLALVRQLVEAMDGRVSVESVVGDGSRFRVTLPLARHTAPRSTP